MHTGAIIKLIKAHGPVTVAELSVLMKMSVTTVKNAIAKAKKERPEEIYISEWKKRAYPERAGDTPLYSFGPGQDTPKPPPLGKTETRRLSKLRNTASMAKKRKAEKEAKAQPKNKLGLDPWIPFGMF